MRTIEEATFQGENEIWEVIFSDLIPRRSNTSLELFLTFWVIFKPIL